ncbi:hypothetical protein [Polyangium sorediatum]|uniref:Uncharacterized protein n=1 Tax=Polyangium sorediatum TaxID=889274 RepID=A0ABT6P5C3_9BACT|nr:hypothetical protein [Polyangium sorediatum]MDI1435512.1 hypothetical protein [Polyangium sorediatum]
MTDHEDLQEIVDRLEEHLDLPVHPTYPLRDREIVGIWRKRSVEALRELGSRGLLTRKDALGKALHESLWAVADAPMVASFEDAPGRTILLGELIRNIVHPGRITQGLKGTCAATCVEIYVAERDPAEYARIIAGLVSPTGQVALRSGGELVRDEDVLEPDEHEYRRSPVSRLFQVACMEFAYPELDYHNAEDGQFEGVKNTGTGLSLGAFDRLLVGITGHRWETLSDGHARFAALFKQLGLDTSGVADLHRDALSIIERVTAAGEAVFATLELPKVRSPVRRAAGSADHAAHKIRVLKLDRPNGTVLYDDPMDPQQTWFEGIRTHIVDRYGRCTMPIADFEKLLVELSYPPELWPGPEQARPAPTETQPESR